MTASYLQGTESFTAADLRDNAAFTDRYAKQWSSSLEWLRLELERQASGRGGDRRRDAHWLEERRRRLISLSGYGMFDCPAGEVSLRPFPASGSCAAEYELTMGNGLRYCGAVCYPADRSVRGIAFLVCGDAGEQRAARENYVRQGLCVISPRFASGGFSFRDHPERKWYACSDENLLHEFAFIAGGSLAGMEAAEWAAVGRHVPLRLGLLAEQLPLIFDCRGRHLLAGSVAAALNPRGQTTLVLADAEAARKLDRQQSDVRCNTIWGFHRHFDLLALLQMAEADCVLFMERGGTPSPESALAEVWFHSVDGGRNGGENGQDSREKQVRRTRVLRADPRFLTELPPLAAAGVPPQSVRFDAKSGVVGDGADLAADNGCAAAIESKLACLEALHGQALREKQARYNPQSLDAAAYKSLVAEAWKRAMGDEPPLINAGERIVRSRAVRGDTRAGCSFEAYEVILESVPGIETAGYLLLPREKSGFSGSSSESAAAEVYPAVICQHGLMGRPEDALGWSGSEVYYRFASSLANKGYVVYVPFMTWGWGGNPARDALAKHAYALGMTPNRLEAAQLTAIVDFLAARPEVDSARIAFYGLSYGGHASLWLAAGEQRLAAVVTAGHFNNWRRKLVSTEIAPPGNTPASFICVDDCMDMFTYDVLRLLDHAELASMLAPRPHMVENGLRDPVTPLRWVEEEHARLRGIYAWLGAGGNAEIEHFDGPHRIWGERSFQFLDKHLRAPGISGPGMRDDAADKETT